MRENAMSAFSNKRLLDDIASGCQKDLAAIQHQSLIDNRRCSSPLLPFSELASSSLIAAPAAIGLEPFSCVKMQ